MADRGVSHPVLIVQSAEALVFRYEMIFIMNFSVQDFIKFTSRMPQIVLTLVSTFKMFRGGIPPDPSRNFLSFVSLAIPGSDLCRCFLVLSLKRLLRPDPVQFPTPTPPPPPDHFSQYLSFFFLCQCFSGGFFPPTRPSRSFSFFLAKRTSQVLNRQKSAILHLYRPFSASAFTVLCPFMNDCA